jgi:cobalt-zinc-cadmium efflux system membrane fusion protein
MNEPAHGNETAGRNEHTQGNKTAPGNVAARGSKKGPKDDNGHGHEAPAKDEAAPGRKKPAKDEHGHEGEAEEDHLVRLNPAEMERFGIEVAVAGSGTLESRISLQGEVGINEDRQTHVVPRIEGVVKEVRKTLGDRVTKGEVLAVLESRELADLKAEYLAALGKVELARARFNREERLWKKKITSEEDYLTARQGYAEARILLSSAEQKLHALGFSHEYLKRLPKESDLSFTRYEITAPFNATVIGKHISLGEMLKDDTEAFVVADLSSVWVNLNVYQRDVPRIRKGQRVLIGFGEDDNQAEGRIAYVEPVVKEETRTAMARVILPNPDRNWRPGMFVTAKVLTGDAGAGIVVPDFALQTIDEQTVVFVQTPEGFKPSPVKTGRQTEGEVEILSGLSEGERYAVKGTLTLKAQVSQGEIGGHSH